MPSRMTAGYQLLVACLVVTVAAGWRQTQAQGSKTSYAPADCKVEVPAGLDVQCGNLTVAEERAKNNGRTISLHIAVIKSTAPHPAPDPVVYLEGGPGGSALEGIADWITSPILNSRDLILFDQRGTGYSDPSLNCPEIDTASQNSAGTALTLTKAAQNKLDAVLACHDRLVKQGVNLAAFNTAESAADVEDLRIALGYKQWNIYGISYGTRLALDTMRDYPKGIRSVVIDSVYPAHEDAWAEGPANADRAFKVLFKRCASDPTCNAAYPKLDKVFYKLIADLDAKPVSVRVPDSSTPDSSHTLVDGGSLVNTVFEALYAQDSIPDLPKLIYDTSQGDYDMLSRYLSNPGSSPSTNQFDGSGTYYSIECGEKVSFTTPDKFTAALAQYPQLTTSFEGDSDNGVVIFPICARWGAKKATASEDIPVVSDIPTLVMAGEYDPITPPRWAQDAAKTLSHSYFFEYPGVGHAASFSGDCPENMMIAFLNHPTRKPDATCIAQMAEPAFTVPQ